MLDMLAVISLADETAHSLNEMCLSLQCLKCEREFTSLSSVSVGTHIQVQEVLKSSCTFTHVQEVGGEFLCWALWVKWFLVC